MPSSIILAIIGLTSCLTEVLGSDQPLPLFPFGQDDEALESGVAGRELRLAFPITVESRFYSNVHISEDGVLSFGHPYPNYIVSLDAVHVPSVAAFFSDINATSLGGGKVFFREETRNTDELIRFDNLIAQHFERDFTTKSLVVVTWFKVAPSSGVDRDRLPLGRQPSQPQRIRTEKNTFQITIGSSEGRSYVALSYPIGSLEWGQSASPSGDIWAQAGIYDGQGKRIIFKESGGPRMLTLDRRSNIGESGTFLFQLGPSLESPSSPAESLSSLGTRITCDTNDDPCHPQAKCTNVDVADTPLDPEGSSSNVKTRAFCCECGRGQVGDGYLCLDEEILPAYRIVGRFEGELNGRYLEQSDLYGFANASSGIAYLSLSAQQPELIYDLQSLFAASGGLHWLFGKTPNGGKSGFLLSVGRLNRSTEVTFVKDGHRVTIEETFQGLSFDNIVRMQTIIRGSLPTISPHFRLQIPEYVNVFYQIRPGELRSNSSQQLQFVSENDSRYRNTESPLEPLTYNVLQYIRFELNPCDEDLLDDPYKVIVSRASVRADERTTPGRVHMHAEVDIRVGKLAADPCDTADCGDALCVPNGDADYRCLCDQGAEFRRGRCVHVTPRVRTCAENPSMCPANAICVDSVRGPFCRCEERFRDTGNRMCELIRISPRYGNGSHPSGDPQDRGIALSSGGGLLPALCSQPCHRMAYCVNHGQTSICRCMQGTIGDGVKDCRPVTCDDNPRLCPVGAHCVASQCRCKPGYVGDGSHCTKEDRLDRSRHMNDRLIYSRGMTILELPTVPSGQQTPARLVTLGDDTSEIVGIAVDCDHEFIYWTDSINGKIFRSRTDGKYREEVITGLKQPEGIAVDPSSRNLFWVDSELRKIQVASIDNFSHTYTLLEVGLDNPRGIAIHPQRGKVYFTDRSLIAPCIGSISMDGTERRNLVSEKLEVPNMLAVDAEADELCWTDAGKKTIECVSLDPSLAGTVGGHRRIIHTGQALRSKMFGIAMFQMRIYWTDWEIPVVFMIDRANSTGNSIQVTRFLPVSGGSSRLYSIAIAPKHCPKIRTPCEVRRGGCPFMCLPTDSYGRSCVCPDSIQKAGHCPPPQLRDATSILYDAAISSNGPNT